MSKRTRRVEEMGQEAILASKARWVVSRAIRTTETLSEAADTMGMVAEWMTQRAAHAATQNELKRSR